MGWFPDPIPIYQPLIGYAYPPIVDVADTV